jgi:hypothetical protein
MKCSLFPGAIKRTLSVCWYVIIRENKRSGEMAMLDLVDPSYLSDVFLKGKYFGNNEFSNCNSENSNDEFEIFLQDIGKKRIICEGLIKSTYKMTYEEAYNLLNNKSEILKKQLISPYYSSLGKNIYPLESDYVKSLNILFLFTQKINEARIRRGIIKLPELHDNICFFSKEEVNYLSKNENAVNKIKKNSHSTLISEKVIFNLDDPAAIDFGGGDFYSEEYEYDNNNGGDERSIFDSNNSGWKIDSHNIIAELMIATNYCIGYFILSVFPRDCILIMNLPPTDNNYIKIFDYCKVNVFLRCCFIYLFIL